MLHSHLRLAALPTSTPSATIALAAPRHLQGCPRTPTALQRPSAFMHAHTVARRRPITAKRHMRRRRAQRQ